MKLRYFGDSYDIVKKSMLAWLSPFGKWQTHPMFTEVVVPTRRRYIRDVFRNAVAVVGSAHLADGQVAVLR
jgi:hypothetical protein